MHAVKKERKENRGWTLLRRNADGRLLLVVVTHSEERREEKVGNGVVSC